MSITESKLEKVHIFPSEDSYKNNINSVGENDLALVSIDNILSEIRSDIQNVATRPYVTEEWHQGSNWYRVWSTGFIEQGGYETSFDYKGTYSCNKNIVFNTPFSTTNYGFHPTTRGDSQMTYEDISTERTTTGLKVGNNIKNGFSKNMTEGISWYACGY